MAFKYKIELRGGSSVIETVNASDLNTAVSTAAFNTNDLIAAVVGGNINITNRATEELVLSNIPHTDFLRFNDNTWGNTAEEVKDALNAFLKGSGHEIDDLTDIDIPATGAAGHGLVFDSTGKTLVMSSSPLLNASYNPPPQIETDPVFTASPAYSITNTNKSNWNTAYSWGDHATAGYVPETRTLTINGTTYDLSADRTWTLATTLVALTDTAISNPALGELLRYNGSTWENWTPNYLTAETDPVYTASSWYSTTNNSANWDTAYGWGDHSTAGYVSNMSTNAGTADVFNILNNSVFAAVDAGADKLVYWDDSNNKLTHLTLGTNLTITGGTLNASGGSQTLAGLTDTDVSSVTNGQALIYNTTTSKWEPGSAGSASPWTTSGSDIYYTTGNVGIGTTTPAEALDVSGRADINDGSNNVLISTGNSSLTTGGNNTAVGYQAAASLTSGSSNTMLGYRSGYSNTTTSNNTFIGFQTGTSQTSGNGTFVGYRAGLNSLGGSNTLIGVSAGQGTASTSTYTNTVAVGYEALNALTNGAGNTAVGYQAGAAVATGANNTYLGYLAGDTKTTSGNTAIGSEALQSGTSLNATAIGYKAGELGMGSYDVAMGWYAGAGTSSGGFNIKIGETAGRFHTGGHSIIIGGSSVLTGANSNIVAIGHGTNAGANTVTVGRSAGNGSSDSSVFVGYQSGSSSTAGNTVAVGYQALTALTTGTQNTAVGYQAGDALTTGVNNTLVGYAAGTALTGSSNAIFGNSAGTAMTSGSGNVVVGSYAGNSITTRSNNVAIGNGANVGSSTDYGVAIGGSATASGGYTTAMGYFAGNGSNGQWNVLNGFNTMRNSSGSYNAVSGGRSMYATGGSYNAVLGQAAMDGGGSNNNYNVAIGYNAFQSGSNNVIIGANAASASGTLTNKLYIENSNSTTPLIYGEFDNDILRVNGTLQVNDPASTGYSFPTATGTLGQVLEVDANGDLIFATPSGGGGGGLGSADQTLTADRTIDTNGFNLDIELDPTGTPDTFTIHDGTHDLFQVDTSTSGDIFSVNDVSGLPEITVNTTNGVDIPNLNFYKGCISGKGGQTSQATYGTQWRSSMSGQSLGRYQTSANNSIITFASGTPSVGDTLSANNYAIATAYLLPGINFSKINLRGNIRAYDANADGETQHMEVWTFDQTGISGSGTTTCTFRGSVSYTFDSTSSTIKPILINSDISYSGDKDTGILIVSHAPTNPAATYNTVFMIEVTVT